MILKNNSTIVLEMAVSFTPTKELTTEIYSDFMRHDARKVIELTCCCSDRFSKNLITE